MTAPGAVGERASGDRIVGSAGGRHRHEPGLPGTFDESPRRLSWDELQVAQRLVAEGHQVRSLPEGRELGKTADLEVCREPAEIKTLGPGAGSRTLTNALIRASAQAPEAIIDASRSGMSRASAEIGVARFSQRCRPGRIQEVRVFGADFELAYQAADLARMAALARVAGPDGAVRRTPPGRRGQQLGIGW